MIFKYKIDKALTLAKSREIQKFLPFLDFLYIVIIGLNSFILLLFHTQTARIASKDTETMTKVIVSAAIIYLIILIVQVITLSKLKEYSDWRPYLYRTRKIFRIIYTLIYLTLVMISQIQMGLFDSPDSINQKNAIYSILSFICTALVGTSCLWVKKFIIFLNHHIYKLKTKKQNLR